MNNLPSPTLQFDFKAIVNNELIDRSGNNFNGTVNGGCTIVADKVMGKCAQFDGTTGYVSLPALPGTGITDFSSGITIGAWVNFAAFQQYSCILNFGQSGGGSDNITLQLDKSNNGVFKYNCVGIDQSINQMYLPLASAINTNNWVYVAVTVDSKGNGALYLSGQQVFTTSTPDTALLPATNIGTFNNFIGNSNWGTSVVKLLQGRLAWLSVYNQALTQDQVNADMLEGEKNRSTSFRKSFPVEFKVYSDNGGDQVPVLYIEQQGNGKDLYLEIINNSSQPLTIPQGSGSATQTNYHFHLHFRPGTLSDNFLKQTSLTINNWSAAITTDRPTGTNCISFMRTGSSIVLGSGESHLVEIGPVNANPVGGARGTNIELLYDNVKLGTSTEIKGSRMQHLTILSQLGQKDIPLHVGIVGSPSILNDGATQNELLLRIANTGSNSIALSTSGSSGISEFEIEILIQPTGELTEWALVDESDTGGLQLTWPVIGLVAQDTNSSTTLSLDEPISNTLSSGTEIIIQPPSGSAISATLAADGSAGASTLSIQSAQSIAAGSVVSLATNQTSWQIGDPATVPASTSGLFSWTINNLAVTEIVSGGSIDFLISGIVSDLPSGQSFITIRYYNIPGYSDGEFRVAVQKSPVVTNGQNVGIGTASPSVALEVSGAVYAYGNSGIGAAPSAQASLNIPYPSGSGNNGLIIGDPSVCTTSYSALSIVVPDNVTTWPFIILDTAGTSALSIDQTGDILTNGNIQATGNIQTNGNVYLENSDASLGIGTASPSAPVHISASQTSLLRIQSTIGGLGNTAGIDFVTFQGTSTTARIEAVDNGDYNGSIAFLVNNTSSTNSSPTEAMRITNEGNVGINTENPSVPLEVSGQFYAHGNSGIGTAPISQASLNIPYPSENVSNGIVIGDASNLQGNCAALSIAVDSSVSNWPFTVVGDNSQGVLASIDQAGNICTKGNIGIGISSPQFPLHVMSTVSYVTNYAYYAWHGDNIDTGTDNSSVSISIYANECILVGQLNVTSDIRIKEVTGVSAGGEDLLNLLRLNITDYHYIDKVNKGGRIKKGLIAQQVEEVFPQAVSKSKDFVPDIYVMAKNLDVNEGRKELTISVEKLHGLETGNLVRLITDNGEVQKEVCAVPDENTFVVSNWTEKTAQVFVFGKQVDDFRSIDYDQVAMLGISAIQELHKAFEKLKRENQALQTQVKYLSADVDEIKRMMANELNFKS